MTGMPFVLTTDADEFQACAADFIESSMQHNVLATILLSVLDGRYRRRPPVFGYQLDSSGAVTAAALRTPPLALLTSEVEPSEVAPMLDAWLAADPDLSGVTGPPATVRALAAGWRDRRGGVTRLTRSMAMHALQTVHDLPVPAPGRLRPARRSERDLLISWWQGFADEAGSYGGAQAIALVDARLDQDGIFVWEDGEAVSLVSTSPAVAGVVRIGPVYTPAQCRRRGYGGTAVAAVSRQALARGADACMLFTDLANPTSNKIYAEVGYRRFGDWEEHLF